MAVEKGRTQGGAKKGSMEEGMSCGFCWKDTAFRYCIWGEGILRGHYHEKSKMQALHRGLQKKKNSAKVYFMGIKHQTKNLALYHIRINVKIYFLPNFYFNRVRKKNKISESSTFILSE